MSGARLELGPGLHQVLVREVTLVTAESGNVFRLGIFLDFDRRSGTTRAEGPHGAYVRGAELKRIASHGCGIELLRYAAEQMGAS